MTDWPPRVLSNLYRNGLQTLYDLLVDLISKSLCSSEQIGGARGDCRLRAAALRKEAEKRLIGEGDPSEYLTLLKKSYAVMSETAPRLDKVSFEQRWTQEQIVERVIVMKFQLEDKPSHVLCAGYRKLRPSKGDSSRDSSQRRSPPGLECVCESSSVDVVNSRGWKILLSRIGDRIMLHLLTHAAVFSPLPNNCFLQVSGGPVSSLVSKPGKPLFIHPGEKMLCGVDRKKWFSNSDMAQQKHMDRNVYLSDLKDEEKQPAYNAESSADDTTSIANESKQASAGNWESAGEKVIGVVRNGTSNISHSSYLKRHRTQSTDIELKLDVVERYLSKDKIDNKRQRRGSGDQVHWNGEFVKPLTVDTSDNSAFESLRNRSHEIPAKCSEATIQNSCIRKAPEETIFQCSVRNRGLLDVERNSHSNDYMKTRKVTEKIGKDRYSQQGNTLYRKPNQALTDLNPVVRQSLKSGKNSKKNAESSMQPEGEALKHEKFPTSVSNIDKGENPLVQDTCSSPSQVGHASTSGKRVRLPSWKRRKLRQAQQSGQDVVSKDLPLESCREGQSGRAKLVDMSQLQKPFVIVEEVITKSGKEESHKAASEFQAPDETFVVREAAGDKKIGSKGPKNTPQSKKSPSGLGTPYGPPEKLIDRAPIFYNSNYSCHPGLPAKHILNTAKPNEAGVAHLISAVFGVHCNISVCSSSAGHMHANRNVSKLNPGRSSRSKSVHKLLRELLSKARRCAFARLLRRHCPLPEGFHSVHKDSPRVSALLPKSQTANTEQKASELDKDMHEDEKEESLSPDPAPEVENFMSHLLGPSYQPRQQRKAARHLETSTSPSKTVLERREFSSISKNKITTSVEMTEQPNEDNAVEKSLDDIPVMEKNKQPELISCYTNHSKVVGFLWAVCRSIIPPEMLGCLRSWRALRSSIAHFVGLRRHEKFNVKHALFKLRLSSFSWLAFQCKPTPNMPSDRVTVDERATQQRRLELWLYWLFASLIVPLIRAHFYVTENENHRQNIFYYRKPVWARIRSNGVRELTRKNYKKLSRQAVAQELKSRVLGFSQIRLLPKRTGLRPIANLAASSQGTLKFSILTKRKATLSQVFGRISKNLSPGGCSRSDGKVLSLPHQSVPPIDIDISECVAVKRYEASSAIDAEKIVSGENHSLVDCLLNSRSSAAPSAGKRKSSLISLEPPKMQKRSKQSVKFSFRSINSVLRDTYYCLKLEKEAHPEDLGSSVFGYCDIHRKILPFIMQLKKSPNGMPRIFLAVCDVTKAYDNIPQRKLQEIVESFVQSSNYNVARYTCITPTLASVRVSRGRACTLADEPKKFVDSVNDLAAKRSHCIFADQAFSSSVRRDQVLAMLEEHVKQNIVQIGSHFYQQKVGIPQGSVLSSLLCSLFYGHFDVHTLLPVVQSHSPEISKGVPDTISAFRESNRESAENGPRLASPIAKAAGLHPCEDIKQMLELSLDISADKGQFHVLGRDPHVGKEASSQSDFSELLDNCMLSNCIQSCEEIEASVLLRLIDDSLFISTSEGDAKIFVESMHRGFKEYGCQANERKTATSFSLRLGNEVLPRKIYKSEDGACFMRWSGLLINCFTLEFQADYTRYFGEHIRSALTVRRENNQGLQLVLKMCQYMRPKCHALFFDPRINSPATIRLNAFQAFLLCAMKFHAYVCCLPRVTGINEPFLFKAVDCAIRYMYGLLRHKMHSVGAEAEAYFPYNELEWLALVAFYRVLKRKQARYQILLHMLQTQLHMPKYTKLKAYPHLSSATDERRSSMFKFIKY